MTYNYISRHTLIGTLGVKSPRGLVCAQSISLQYY